jgi:hypothetical protein
LEATTGWRFVTEELHRVGAVVHLAEPAETAARRGNKRRAKSDTAVTILAELGDARRFSSSRNAVRFAGLDITVHQSDQRPSEASSATSRAASTAYSSSHRQAAPHAQP